MRPAPPRPTVGCPRNTGRASMRRICSAGMSPHRSAVTTAATRPQATSDPDHPKSNPPIETPPGSTNRLNTCNSQTETSKPVSEPLPASSSVSVRNTQPAHAERHPNRHLPPAAARSAPASARRDSRSQPAGSTRQRRAADEAFRFRPGLKREGCRGRRHERHGLGGIGPGAWDGRRGERRVRAGGRHSRSQPRADGDPELGGLPQPIDRDDGIGKVVRRRKAQRRRAQGQEEVGWTSQI